MLIPIHINYNEKTDKITIGDAIAGQGISLSPHAQLRLQDRFPHLTRDDFVEILKSSKEITRKDSGSTKVNRIIKNGFQEEKYIINLEYDICLVLPIEHGQIKTIRTIYPVFNSWVQKVYPDIIIKKKEPKQEKSSFEKLSKDHKEFLIKLKKSA
jgi:hypothetical protein